MKTLNRGITLVESLCYIVIFSLIITVVGGYLIYINKFSLKTNDTLLKEITFIESLCNNIYDYKIVNKEDIYVSTNNNTELIIKGINTKQVYFSFNYETNEMYNGLLGRTLCFEDLLLEFTITKEYVYITNNTKVYHFIIEV